MKKKLLIFVVTYKASFRIFNLIKKIPFKELSKFNYQIYISDDNSDDNVFLKTIMIMLLCFMAIINIIPNIYQICVI